MKRTWFAILFLLLVAGLCIFEQHTVKTTFENMETLLQSMDAAAAEENYPEAERKARQLQNIWTANCKTFGPPATPPCACSWSTALYKRRG